jgi:hypothetical protein
LREVTVHCCVLSTKEPGQSIQWLLSTILVDFKTREPVLVAPGSPKYHSAARSLSG